MKTVVLVRHADVDPPPEPAPDNWPLNAAGEARAQTLAFVTGNAGVIAIYVSEALRTQQTAAPLAAKLDLQVQIVPDLTHLAQVVLADADGPAVLIVGHGNTVPDMITALGAPAPEATIHGHDDLFVVTVAGPGKASLTYLKYGAATP
jgi:broad specificity phosphatase PhoE